MMSSEEVPPPESVAHVVAAHTSRIAQVQDPPMPCLLPASEFLVAGRARCFAPSPAPRPSTLLVYVPSLLIIVCVEVPSDA